MPRRSSRAHKMVKVIDSHPDISSGDDGEATFESPSDEEDDEELVVVEKKAKATKRKRAGHNTSGQPPAKRLRGKRGILSQLLEMPYDIQAEIFSRLHPADLLNLMRTSKDLRSFFSSRKNSESLWQASRDHFQGLPECPDDLSEPQYAELVFGKGCQVCLRRVGVLHTSWSARLRVCNKCLNSKFTTYLDSNEMVAGLRDVVPHIIIMKPDEIIYYYSREKVDLFYKLSKEIWRIGTKRTLDLLHSTMMGYRSILDHSEDCMAWAEKHQANIQKDKESVVDNRKDIVLDRLREEGWDDELDRMSQAELNTLKNLPDVAKACRKQLTKKVILNLVQNLNEYMREFKHKMIRQDRTNLLRNRISVLEQIIEDYRLTISPNEAREFPGIPDLFCHPVIRDAIKNIPDGDFNKSRLEPTKPFLPDIVRDIRTTIRDQAIALVVAALGETQPVDLDSVLDLATTLFSCSACSCNVSVSCYDLHNEYPSHHYVSETLRFPDIMYHSCATLCHSSVMDRPPEPDRYFRHFADEMQKANWNRYSQISYKAENHRVLADAITLCGFDPKVATIAQMDAADPILECVPCNHPSKGRATMRWSLVAAHYHDSHVKNGAVEMKLELLNEDDKRIVRRLMGDQMDRERAEPCPGVSGTRPHYRNSMTCAHCLYEGVSRTNSVAVTEHVQAEHGIASPMLDEDIVPIPSKRFIQSVLFLWPPRDATRRRAAASAVNRRSRQL